MTVTRGFKGKHHDSRGTTDRVPPGQYVTQEFPVLTAGPTQQTPLESWSLALQNGGQLLARWNWREFEALPQTERRAARHAVGEPVQRHAASRQEGRVITQRCLAFGVAGQRVHLLFGQPDHWTEVSQPLIVRIRIDNGVDGIDVRLVDGHTRGVHVYLTVLR